MAVEEHQASCLFGLGAQRRKSYSTRQVFVHKFNALEKRLAKQ